jgi:uncharacterized membrane protein (UPF0127 family)
MSFTWLSGSQYRIYWQFTLAALLFLPVGIAGTPKPSLQTPLRVEIEQKQYQMAVASTPEQQEQGLMYQTTLAKRTGMLFPISPNRRVAFWMKNTLIPLDMLFVQNNRLVQIVHSAQPCKADPCSTYASNSPIDTVIELPGGTAKEDHLEPGARVQIMWLQ